MNAEGQRKVIHIDMDAFYASVEQRDHPEYRGRALIVGGSPESRGVVATCSYEARRFGIHSAMPSAHAYRLCPDAVFVRPRFQVYRAESRRIQAIFHAHTDLVEPLSLDEAYLDVTGCGSATRLAREIKTEIYDQTGLIASAGVSYNKFLAKIASDRDKPDGLFLIPPEKGEAFVRDLPVVDLHGVGPKTGERMHALGIRSGADLRRWSVEDLQQHFGKVGRHYYNLARGVDTRPVSPRRERKSVGTETTFARDLHAVDDMQEALDRLAGESWERLQRRRLSATTLTIKVKYGDFRQVTRSWSSSAPFASLEQVRAILPRLLERTEADSRSVRLLGVTFSALAESDPARQFLLL